MIQDVIPRLEPGTQVVARVLGWEEFYEGGPIPEWVMGSLVKREITNVVPAYMQYTVDGICIDPLTAYEPLTKHLPGEHNQKTHGRRGAQIGLKPPPVYEGLLGDLLDDMIDRIDPEEVNPPKRPILHRKTAFKPKLEIDNPRWRRAAEETIELVRKKVPDAWSKDYGIKRIADNDAYGNLYFQRRPDVFAFYSPLNREIHLNVNHTESRITRRAREHWLVAVRSQKYGVGRGYTQIMAHEIGHGLYFTLTNHRKFLVELNDRLEKAYPKIAKRSKLSPSWSTQMRGDQYINLQQKEEDLAERWLDFSYLGTDVLSNYSNTSMMEFIAEAFADGVLSDQPTMAGQIVIDLLNDPEVRLR